MYWGIYETMNKMKHLPFHIARILAAALLLMTLRHKLGGTDESVQLFTQLGSETWSRIATFGGEPTGRYVVGILELIAGILLLVPRAAWFGGLMGMGLMVGAFIFHAFILGFDALFVMALIVLFASAYVAWHERKKIMNFVVEIV